MRPGQLIRRGLVYYWRTNLAVVAGVATAVGVLSGALLVGDSVRGSLRAMVLERIGNTDHVIIATGFVRDALAGEVAARSDFTGQRAVPLIVTEATVTMQVGEGRANRVRVYGVDDRFWEFHGVGSMSGPENRDGWVSPALSATLGAVPGDTLLVRIQRPTDVPVESVFGRKDEIGQTVRAVMAGTLDAASMGEFSLSAQQGTVEALFLPLSLIQDELGVDGRANTLLVSGTDSASGTASIETVLRSVVTLDDLGLSLSTLDDGTVALDAADGVIADAVVDAVIDASFETGMVPHPLFTYLANTIRVGEREIPYSLVTALEFSELGFGAIELDEPPPIVLTDWAGDDLNAVVGDTVTLDYYLWEEPGRLVTRTMDFELARVVPTTTGDVRMAPDYPGITDSVNLGDWDPPFAIDLGRIRDQDEEYWNQYRTTPKAFIPYLVGNRLWQTRYGTATEIRLTPPADTDPAVVLEQFAAALATAVDPLAAGLTVVSTRQDGLESSTGAVNFGEYFVYFSFFIVVAALMLAALFFKLSVEQRVREVGLLRSVGFTPPDVRRIFMGEGAYLALAGTVLGVAAGLGYGALIITALGTWWVDAVGTEALVLHVTPLSLSAGAAGGLLAALIAIRVTLGRLTHLSERQLLSGETGEGPSARPERRLAGPAGVAMLVASAGLIGAAATNLIPDAAGFFGAGAAVLAGALCLFVDRFRDRRESTITGQGLWPVGRLGMRSVTYRPARGVLAVGMIATATFILISVDAFRKGAVSDTGPASGIGGYGVIVESLLPLVHDLNGPEGREAVGLASFDGITIEEFRFRPGDDASCLNLYTPRNPRIIAPTNDFVTQGRFAFAGSMASNDTERENPWLLLRGVFDDGAIPVIADANSLTYVLHTAVGRDFLIVDRGREIRLRVVAALRDSIFQGEFIMSEANFVDLFPDEQGYPYFLVETPDESIPDVVNAIELALEDHGAVATPAADRLAEFHRVENTYLSTFQALGGLGLLLGTVGLGAVLLRNVLERRKELALLRALGYRQVHFFVMVIAENAFLLIAGLITGSAAAIVAIAPAIADRGGRLPGGFLLMLLGGVLAAGLLTSLLATITALRAPLISALRSE